MKEIVKQLAGKEDLAALEIMELNSAILGALHLHLEDKVILHQNPPFPGMHYREDVVEITERNRDIVRFVYNKRKEETEDQNNSCRGTRDSQYNPTMAGILAAGAFIPALGGLGKPEKMCIVFMVTSMFANLFSQSTTIWAGENRLRALETGNPKYEDGRFFSRFHIWERATSFLEGVYMYLGVTAAILFISLVMWT